MKATLVRVLSVVAVIGGLLAFSGGVASAAPTVVFDGSPGTGAPPATLGPYTMTPFGDDARPEFSIVSSVPSPLGGNVSFSRIVGLRTARSGWTTWSNGYTGDVYAASGTTSLTLTLPAGTTAFYLYAEPDTFGVHNITATAANGTTSGPVPVEGNAGAKYFGFYAIDTTLTTITITPAADVGSAFAVGEFGISAGPAVTATALCNGTPPRGAIVGTAGQDSLTGTGGSDVIFGLGGNDMIDGGGGDDIICGGDGNDYLAGGEGNDTIVGGAGNDRLVGQAGDDQLLGGAGFDYLDGGPGINTLDGGTENDFCQNGTTVTNCP